MLKTTIVRYLRKELLWCIIAIVLSGVSYFAFFVAPTYSRIGWYYPFGWDTAVHVHDANYILTYSYGNYLVIIRYFPNLYPLLLALVSGLFGTNSITAGIWLPLALTFGLAIAYFALSKIMYNSYLYAFTAFFVTLYSVSTMRIFGEGLHRDLLFLIEFSLLVFFVAKFEANQQKRNILCIALLSVACWATWGTPSLVYLLLVFLVSMVLTRTDSLKIGAAIVPTIVTELASNVANANQFSLLIAGFKTPRPEYTFDMFVLFSGNTYLLAIMAILGSFQLLLLGFRCRETNRRFLLFISGAISSLFIIGLLISPFTEVKYRLTYALPYGIVIASIPYWISTLELKPRLLGDRRFTVSRRTFRIIAVLLCGAVIVSSSIGTVNSFNDFMSPYIWRRWVLDGNDSTFFRSLQSIERAYNSDNIYILLFNNMAVSMPPEKAHLLAFYVRSYIPNTAILYFNQSDLTMRSLLMSVHLNSSYLDPFWSFPAGTYNEHPLYNYDNSTIAQKGVLVFQNSLFIDKYNILQNSSRIDKNIYTLPVNILSP